MKIIILVSFFILSMFLAIGSKETPIITETFKVIKYPQLEELIAEKSDKLRVFNFWATWCAPCIKEMPHFEKINKDDPDVELYFISMDDGRKLERVTNFIEKRKILAPVYLLDDVDYNTWIDKVNPQWSGAIPATLFVKPDGSRHFHEGEVDEKELHFLIKKLK